MSVSYDFRDYNTDLKHLFITQIDGVSHKDTVIYGEQEFQKLADLCHGGLPLNLRAYHFNQRERMGAKTVNLIRQMPPLPIPVRELLIGGQTDVARGLKLYQRGRSRSGSPIWRRFKDFVLVHSDCAEFGRLAYLDGKQSLLLSEYKAFPISLREANEYIDQHHRHNSSVQGHKFSIGVKAAGGNTVGVTVAGLPISRHQNDGKTLEIRRTCCNELYYNVNSVLMGKVIRIAKEMGYERLLTYTLPYEGGGSLKAVGFRVDAVVKGKKGYGWDSTSRHRKQPEKYPGGDKLRWIVNLAA